MRLPCGRGGGGEYVDHARWVMRPPTLGLGACATAIQAASRPPSFWPPLPLTPASHLYSPHSPSFNLFPLFPCLLLHTILLLLCLVSALRLSLRLRSSCSLRAATTPCPTAPRGKIVKNGRGAYLCTHKSRASSAAPLSGARAVLRQSGARCGLCAYPLNLGAEKAVTAPWEGRGTERPTFWVAAVVRPPLLVLCVVPSSLPPACAAVLLGRGQIESSIRLGSYNVVFIRIPSGCLYNSSNIYVSPLFPRYLCRFLSLTSFSGLESISRFGKPASRDH
jgi:hypothetical protein